MTIPLGPAGALLSVLGIVWAINLYNFMDGIDGIAAAEAIVASLAGAGLLLWQGQGDLASISLIVAGASAGFLVWNWEPARIFMGDVGSGFLGFVFGTLALASERRGAMPALVWILLLGLFFGDATVTLLRRMLRGERWFEAHSNHAYQRLVRAGLRHRTVTGLIAGLTLVLAGLGVITIRWPLLLPAALLTGSGLVGTYLWLVERRMPMPPADLRGRIGKSRARRHGQGSGPLR
jgi:Fuc2NAc and GlcNAc transferase